MTTTTRSALCLLLLASTPAFAADNVAALAGTWECRLPGETKTKRPPIVWIEPAPGGDAGKIVVEVDGFARDIAGTGVVTTASEGWWKVTPQQGVPFFMKEVPPPRGIAGPAMALRRTDTGPIYQCLRLPRYAPAAAKPAAPAPATQPSAPAQPAAQPAPQAQPAAGAPAAPVAVPAPVAAPAPAPAATSAPAAAPKQY